MTWASRRVFASSRRQAVRREGWRAERVATERKGAEIRMWLHGARRYCCLHCGGLHPVETIRGGAGHLGCSDPSCDGNPLDWCPVDAAGFVLAQLHEEGVWERWLSYAEWKAATQG